MEVDLAAIAAGLAAMFVGLDKYGFWNRRKKGKDLASKIERLDTKIEHLDAKVDAHMEREERSMEEFNQIQLETVEKLHELGERVSKIEGFISGKVNGSGI